MKILALLTAAAGVGILVGYYLETTSPVLTTGLALTMGGTLLAIIATNKARG